MLPQLIAERIQREGPIPFAEYMRMALYEPSYGYYVTGTTIIGWEGDFYTSTDISGFFAHCMGRQLMRMWEQLKCPTPFVVLEQGAGRGHLAQQVCDWAMQEHADFRAALEYRTEDIRLGQDAIQSIHDMEISPSVIVSNELVDAFPVHIVEKRNNHLYEVFVDMHHGRLHEVLDEPSSSEVATYLDTYKIPWTAFEDGWRAEINLNAIHWMQHTARRLMDGEVGQGGEVQDNKRPRSSYNKRKGKHGFLLVIDYGEKARELYTRYRRRGTLACYYQHQVSERPLVHPGKQDITAHVNFSALIDEGRRQGLRLHNYTTQKAWLEDMGIHEELAHIRQRDYAIIDTDRASDKGQIALLQWYNLRQRVAALTDPVGMGNFKVLIMKC